MKVSIVVPFHRMEYLEDCVKSLTEQTHKDTEVILVDDSQDSDVGYAALFLITQYAGIRYISQPEKGYEAGARQRGLDLATGEVVLQTDSDAVYPPEFIEMMLKKLVETDAIGVEQRYIAPIKATDSLAFYHAKYKRKASLTLKGAGKKEPYGGTMYYTRAREFTRYKPLLIGTDTEFVKDLKKLGFKFAWCETAFFFHHDPHTLWELFRRSSFYYMHVQESGIFYLLKRSIAFIFPFLTVFAGERKMQYAHAIQDQSVKGIFGIFVGNFIIDWSSGAYILRWFVE